MSTSLRNVIISGFHDSIGLYTKSTDTEKAIANEWLALLGMSDRADEPFNRLSFGDQRLVLIARAMVKHPPLLILDEPCLGLDDMNRRSCSPSSSGFVSAARRACSMSTIASRIASPGSAIT